MSDRNIPTCVGKTLCSRRVRACRSEHPHMCGENPDCFLLSKRDFGTSPHVWGKPLRSHHTSHCSRNIPTCVGKTSTARTIHGHVPEHPHMCGENPSRHLLTSTPNGTSPHVWGKLLFFLGNFRIPRKEFGIAQGRKRLYSTITSDTWSIVKEQSQMFKCLLKAI